jgi:hypothetical protein
MEGVPEAHRDGEGEAVEDPVALEVVLPLGDLLSVPLVPGDLEEEMEDEDMYDREISGRGQLDDVAERIQANRQKSELNVAKGGAKNMREMLAKLKSKIKCH